MPLTALIEEVVAPHRNFGVAIDVTAPPERDAEPVGARNPAILYGLGNLLENAVDFARERVVVGAQWNEDAVDVTISDDGPGFAPESWTASASPMSPAAAAIRTTADDEPAGLGLVFHRQDLARTLGRHAQLREPLVSRTRRHRHGALEPARFRAAVNLRGVLRSRHAIAYFYAVIMRRRD